MVRYVYVLEDDAKTQIEILESLRRIDPKLYIRFFTSLEQFAKWMQLLMIEGAKAVHNGGVCHQLVTDEVPLSAETPARLALLISKNEILGSQNIPLLRKTSDLFVRVGLATAADPTAIVITAFDNPDFDIKLVEDRLINNLIFKPFDQLILTQHLTFALDGRHPPSSFSIHNMKTDATIEMMKDVQVQAVSNIGFITRSNRKIEPGKIAKYYSDFFEAGRTRSLMAMSLHCEQHPEFPQDFLCSFAYYGMSTEQISSIRKKLTNKKLIHFPYKWERGSDQDEANIVVIDTEEGTPGEVSATIKRLFKNVHVVGYKNLAEFLVDMDPSQFSVNEKQSKAFPNEAKFKIFFDDSGRNMVKTDPVLTEAQTVIGFKSDEFLKIDFRQFVESGSKAKFRGIIDGLAKTAEDHIFTLKQGEFQYFIKAEGRRLVEEAGVQYIELSLTELTTEERKQWLAKLSRLPQRVDAIICREVHFRDGAEERWQTIRDGLRDRLQSPDDKKNYQLKVFMIAERRLTDAEVRDFGHHALDVFYKPIERQYIAYKLKLFLQQLEAEEELEIKTVAYTANLEVGNPVQISELSEAGIVMKYYRSISIGSFRKFVLWMPQEIGAPVYRASCNYFEEIEKGVFANHFVFFGMSDNYLKHIRLWIRESYINAKDKGS